jgi:hypothetical protein
VFPTRLLRALNASADFSMQIAAAYLNRVGYIPRGDTFSVKLYNFEQTADV